MRATSKSSTEAGAAGVTHENIMDKLIAVDRRLADGDTRFKSFDTTLKEISEALKSLHQGQDDIRKDIEPLVADISTIRELIGASKALKVWTKAIVWIGIICGALTGMIAFAKSLGK